MLHSTGAFILVSFFSCIEEERGVSGDKSDALGKQMRSAMGTNLQSPAAYYKA